MIRVGITGSIASGKTTVGKILSKKKGPFFSADDEVKKLYRAHHLKVKISKKLNFKLTKKFKSDLKRNIINNKKNLKILEKIIHPLVRKKMKFFLRKNKNKKYSFCEIPLLIESKLTKNFDLIIFVKSNKKKRLKRFKSKGGSTKLFNLLNSIQLKDSKKEKFSDYIVVNNSSLSFLKKKVLNIIGPNE